jgi:hypothetical protein
VLDRRDRRLVGHLALPTVLLDRPRRRGQVHRPEVARRADQRVGQLADPPQLARQSLHPHQRDRLLDLVAQQLDHVAQLLLRQLAAQLLPHRHRTADDGSSATSGRSGSGAAPPSQRPSASASCANVIGLAT